MRWSSLAVMLSFCWVLTPLAFAQQDLDTLKAAVETAKQDWDDEQERVDALTAQRADLKAQLQDHPKGSPERQVVREALDAVVVDLRAARADRDAAQATYQIALAALEAAEAGMDQAPAGTAQTPEEIEIAQLQADLAAAQAALTVAETRLAAALAQNVADQDEIATLTATVADAEKQVADAEARLTDAEAELEDVQAHLDDVMQDMAAGCIVFPDETAPGGIATNTDAGQCVPWWYLYGESCVNPLLVNIQKRKKVTIHGTLWENGSAIVGLHNSFFLRTDVTFFTYQERGVNNFSSLNAIFRGGQRFPVSVYAEIQVGRIFVEGGIGSISVDVSTGEFIDADGGTFRPDFIENREALLQVIDNLTLHSEGGVVLPPPLCDGATHPDYPPSVGTVSTP